MATVSGAAVIMVAAGPASSNARISAQSELPADDRFTRFDLLSLSACLAVCHASSECRHSSLQRVVMLVGDFNVGMFRAARTDQMVLSCNRSFFVVKWSPFPRFRRSRSNDDALKWKGSVGREFNRWAKSEAESGN
eukprot:1989878-Pleurochrysis_carterae.AAC.1